MSKVANKSYGVWSILLAVAGLSVMRAAGLFPGWVGSNWVSPWNANNWLATWDQGFVMRGFVGTIMGVFCHVLTLGKVMIVSGCFTGAYVALVAWASVKLYSKKADNAMLLMILFFLAQPSVIQWWGSPVIFARMDLFLVIGVVLSFASLNFGAAWLRYAVLLLLTFASMLVHEGFAVLFVPIIFSGLIVLGSFRLGIRNWQPWIYYLVPVFLGWFAVVSQGSPTLPYNGFVDVLRMRASGFEVFGEEFVRLAYYMGLGERVKVALSCMTLDMAFRLVLTLVIMAPTVWILGCMWCSAWRQVEGSRRYVLAYCLMASLSPLAAFILGSDFFRWLAYCLFNNIVILAFLAFVDEKVRDAISDVVERSQGLVLAAIIISISAGVPGAMTSYPVVELVAQVIRRAISSFP